MFENYLRVVIRNLLRQRIYTFVNIFGLAIGIAFCILTFLFVRNEWTYDWFHKNGDHIYRVISLDKDQSNKLQGFGITTAVMAPALVEEVQGIQYAARLKTMPGTIKNGDQLFNEEFLCTDSDFLKMFSFPFVRGNLETALLDKNSVVLTEETARKYFGDEDPLGETISIKIGGYYSSDGFRDFIVRGVTRGVPENSTIKFRLLLSFENITSHRMYRAEWERSDTPTYVQISENVPLNDIKKRFSTFIEKHFESVIQTYYDGDKDAIQFGLQPLKDIHFNQQVEDFGIAGTSKPTYSLILIAISLAVLLIACINFVNLSLGRCTTRFKEIGVRKTAGATRKQIVAQFLSESMMLSFFSLLLGIGMAELLLPVFNTLIGKELSLGYFSHTSTLIALIGLMLFVGMASGGYPAIVLSRLHPVKILKGSPSVQRAKLFNRILVMIQFGLSIFFIIVMVTMTEQLHFIKSKNLGFRPEQVVVVKTDNLDDKERTHLLSVFRRELVQYKSILNVSASQLSLNEGGEGRTVEFEGSRTDVCCFPVDYNYLKTLGIELIEGRDFSSSDLPLQATIVSESLLKQFGWNYYPGMRFLGFLDKPEIIGVVKDHHFRSLHHLMEPVVLYLNYDRNLVNILIRISPGDVPDALALIKNKWKAVVPDSPLEYSLLDEDIYRQYQTEERWSRIIKYASLSTLVIACIGILGLTALAISKRTKEIGVRKVLGASIPRIVLILAKEFSQWVVIANIIAWPIAWYAMNKWLQNFAYRIDLTVWPFLLSGVIALVIALLTVSWQAVRAATANPAEALRYE
jgi:putative ABC transport system permease protein